MTMVLVHGGGLGKECWDRLLPFLDGDVLAVDLPGRGDHPADLAEVGVAEVRRFRGRRHRVAGDLHDVVLVGHSLAGLTIPQVAGRVPDRIRALVFISCTVPRRGAEHLRHARRRDSGHQRRAPERRARGPRPRDRHGRFYNDVDDPEVLEWGLSILVPEAPAAVMDTMVLSTMPRDLRRVWIRLNDDVIVAPAKQDRFVENLGGCEVLELDSGHMAMISRPRDLAALLNAI